MDENLIDHIKDDLNVYKGAIEEIDKNFDKIERLGRYQARTLFIYKHEISFYIEYAEKKGIDLSDIKKIYKKINEKLFAFEQQRGKTWWLPIHRFNI